MESQRCPPGDLACGSEFGGQQYRMLRSGPIKPEQSPGSAYILQKPEWTY